MFVSVKFNPNHDRTYTYAYAGEKELTKGDLVLVETAEGKKIVTVENCNVDKPSFACKPIYAVCEVVA
ncbi:MAG: hypothetical protein II336_18020 [Loktanella sp.]|nr:hypothetical protein [Loktanella sp.]